MYTTAFPLACSYTPLNPWYSIAAWVGCSTHELCQCKITFVFKCLESLKSSHRWFCLPSLKNLNKYFDWFMFPRRGGLQQFTLLKVLSGFQFSTSALGQQSEDRKRYKNANTFDVVDYWTGYTRVYMLWQMKQNYHFIVLNHGSFECGYSVCLLLPASNKNIVKCGLWGQGRLKLLWMCFHTVWKRIGLKT